jgi:hypothetical protein
MQRTALIVGQHSRIPIFHHSGVSYLARFLLLQLLELLFRLLDLSLLCRHLLLEFLFLLLSLLNLVADQGAADQAYDSAYAGSYASVARCATDNSPQTCAGTGPDDRALLGCGQRLSATEKKHQ